MRLRIALGLFQLLFLASPAFAQITDDLGSDNQVNQYGHIFGYLAAAVGAVVVILVTMHVIKGIRAEHSRGKKRVNFQEEILDKAPKKKPDALLMGERVPDWKIDNRRKATKSALEFISSDDKRFDRRHLVVVSNLAIKSVRSAVEARSSKKLDKLLTASCLAKVKAEIKGLREEGKIHNLSKLEVTDVEIVHLEAPEGKLNHTFIALITAKSKDYFQDEKTGEVLRGDKKTYVYQEFFCFKRFKAGWLLDRIRPSEDMDRVLAQKLVLDPADMDEFSKDVDPALLREFVTK